MKTEHCRNCKYSAGVYAQNNFRFLGCKFPPYKGKWIAEIAECPRFAEGTKYKCKKKLFLDWYDEDGFVEEENKLAVCRGEIYIVKNEIPSMTGNDEAIHLENDSGNWIEIMPDTLDEYFDVVKDKESGASRNDTTTSD